MALDKNDLILLGIFKEIAHGIQPKRYWEPKEKLTKRNQETDWQKWGEWRAFIFYRDGYKCVKCGSESPLEAAHILDWEAYPDRRYDVENGKTLCKSCHDLEHPWRVAKRNNELK